MHAKERPIIVLSTGRAGSTLLQKLLNTNQELVIWGEHAGILNQLMYVSRVVSNSDWIQDNVPKGAWLLQEDRPLNEDRWTAWDGSFSKKGFHKYMKKFIDDIFSKDVPENIRWGFKEIRYRNIAFMDFMSDLYPHVQFILLLRNPIDSCVSFTTASAPKGSETSEDFSSTMRDMASKQIKPVFKFFKEAMENYPIKSRVVLFEQLVENPHEVLDDISGFLGLSSGFKDTDIARIMQNNIVSERRRTSGKQLAMLKSMAIPLLEDQHEWYGYITGKFTSHN